MKTGVIRLLSFGAFLLPLTLSAEVYSVPAVNLVQNGTFESGLSGWTLTGNGGCAYGFYGGTGHGAYIGLDSMNLSPLYQSVPTTPGQTYSVSFDMRGSYPAQEAPPFAIDVFWNSQLVGRFSVNVYSSDWATENLLVTGGPGSESRLEFRNPLGSMSSLDSVSVVAVPEPSSCALTALGAAALAWIGRKRA